MIVLINTQNLTTIGLLVLEIISRIKIDTNRQTDRRTDRRQTDGNERPLLWYTRGHEKSRKPGSGKSFDGLITILP